MATSPVIPDHLTLTEDTFHQLQKLADAQGMSLSEALAQAIKISDIIVRQEADPQTRILIKRGNNYQRLTLGK